jgi:hypothetical protein
MSWLSLSSRSGLGPGVFFFVVVFFFVFFCFDICFVAARDGGAELALVDRAKLTTLETTTASRLFFLPSTNCFFNLCVTAYMSPEKNK